MLQSIIPKLPMRDKSRTKAYYVQGLGFEELAEYGNYLILKKDEIEIHFFEFPDLNPLENYGQVYIRTIDIETLYQELVANNFPIHPNGALAKKPWGQQEFSLLDPDHNLLTFGESLPID
jgi:catechol 2,3-dioxygenase-like lactoylglutathione lyase family enzyme